MRRPLEQGGGTPVALGYARIAFTPEPEMFIRIPDEGVGAITGEALFAYEPEMTRHTGLLK
jgi:hypothetical protein